MNLLLVVLGGGIGAGGRYLMGAWLHSQLGTAFPWGTFAVNALGALLIGLVFGLARQGSISAPCSSPPASSAASPPSRPWATRP